MDLVALASHYNRAAEGVRAIGEGRHRMIYGMQDLIRAHRQFNGLSDYEVGAALMLELGRMLSKHDSMQEERELMSKVFTDLASRCAQEVDE